jgi:hypothetical protein
MPQAGMQTRNPNAPAAADPGLRPRGHWNRPGTILTHKNIDNGEKSNTTTY